MVDVFAVVERPWKATSHLVTIRDTPLSYWRLCEETGMLRMLYGGLKEEGKMGTPVGRLGVSAVLKRRVRVASVQSAIAPTSSGMKHRIGNLLG